jgi:hypothetical protein
MTYEIGGLVGDEIPGMMLRLGPRGDVGTRSRTTRGFDDVGL